MQRYLLSFSYKGTKFSGSQKLLARHVTAQLAEKLKGKETQLKLLSDEERLLLEKEEKTVQGALETAVEYRIKPQNKALIYLSSRTDSGVHAFKNTCTIDLVHPTGNYYSTSGITSKLNYHFFNRNLDIRVNDCLAVHPDFHARQDTCSRTYLYQIVTTPLQPHKLFLPNRKEGKTQKGRMIPEITECRLPIWISESYCQIKEEDFDLQKMQDTLTLFKGIHNFKSFCRSSGWVRNVKCDQTGRYIQQARTEEEFLKSINDIQINKVPSPLPNSPQFECFSFYHITIKGRSFLHNQIRRMVGVGLSVCQGKMDLHDVVKLLENPNDGFPAPAKTAQPYGLYLVDIEYTETSMRSATSKYEDLPVPSITGEEVTESKECTI